MATHTPRAARPGLVARLSAWAALALVSASVAAAAQWIVDDDGPADFRYPQTAVDASYVHTGDTIVIRPGYYPGSIVLNAKDLVIRSETGPFATILDAQQSGPVVYLYNRTGATRIEGFTLTRGRAESGGGVYIYGGGPVITRNVIEGNSAVGGFMGYGYGGGVEIDSSAAVITRNVIRGNTALDGGGGIDVYRSGPSTPGTCCALISQNTIVGNRTLAAASMGGGVLSSASEARISSCIIAGNEAVAGGGIFVERVQGNNDQAVVSSNILFANAAGDWDTNGNWRLPSSNPLTDPLLGEGNWIDLWPRSTSPALDAAEPGLPAGADLVGNLARDSDLEGGVAGDVGAVENVSEITGLVVASDPARPESALLSWDDSINPSVAFDLYFSDQDPFSQDGGACLASSLILPTFEDVETLTVGAVRFYLVAGRDAAQGVRGLRSDGTPTPSVPSCL